jgi:predicted ATPase
MRLAVIELENFKGIGDRQRVELRPITLLFGPNSAGKSTVIQALHYVREVLARRNVDPDITVAGGLLNLGGFASLIHRHELDRSMRVKLEVDLLNDQEVAELPLNSGTYLEEDDFTDLQVRYLVGESEKLRDYAIVHTVGIELEVRWSEQEVAAFISRIAIELNGLYLLTIASPPERGRAQLIEFNFVHPLLQPAESPDLVVAPDVHIGSPLEDLLWLLSRESGIDRSKPETPHSEIRVGIGTVFGALPNIDAELYVDLRDPEPKRLELEYRTPRVLALRRLLDEIVLGPLRIVCRCLEDMTYIGPLRQVPTRGYRPQVSPDEARWAQGLAAWDLLHTVRDNELIANASRWLSDPQKLNTGYQLERLEFRRVPIPGPFAAHFQRGLQEDDIVDLQALFEQLPREREVALRELRTGLLVGPSDIGVGLSQLVPVIVAVLEQDKRLLAIEQPELHVHPAIQVGLGDLLISGVRTADQELPRDRVLLIETHSEHIMLRLLRRIRETAENELPPGAVLLQPDDVAVVYVEIPQGDEETAEVEGVRFTPLRVSGEGEFVDRWPKGFFEERVEELF